MTGSPSPHPHPNPSSHEERNNNNNNEEETEQLRPCDYCNHSIALLYCRADSAKLCFSCDREVHSTNQLFSKHTRNLLCDNCDASPASILCSTESSVLCQNCDWERHNLSLSPVHERRPLEGFTGTPSVTELLAIVGFEDVGKKALLSSVGESGGVGGFGSGGGGDGFLGSEIEGISDFFVWDAPSVVSLDDLISSSGSSHNFHAMEVPPLPKNRKAACGIHREEILSQLRELAKSEPLDTEDYFHSGNLSTDPERDFKANDMFPSYEWHGESGEAMNQVVPPDTTSLGAYTEEVAVEHSNPAVWETPGHTYGNNDQKPPIYINSEALSTTPKAAAPCELTSQERDSALLRYKEKKKTRRYDKHIRYESRKVRAQSRIRVKGRFAKMEH